MRVDSSRIILVRQPVGCEQRHGNRPLRNTAQGLSDAVFSIRLPISLGKEFGGWSAFTVNGKSAPFGFMFKELIMRNKPYLHAVGLFCMFALYSQRSCPQSGGPNLQETVDYINAHLEHGGLSVAKTMVYYRSRSDNKTISFDSCSLGSDFTCGPVGSSMSSKHPPLRA